MTPSRWFIAWAAACSAASGWELASAQQTIRVSVDSAGIQANDHSWLDAASTNGRFVAFESKASNLIPGDTNANWDVFVHDAVTGATECVSLDPYGNVGNGWSGTPAISSDGRFVVFNSEASSLVAGDANGLGDVFLRDRDAGTTELVTLSTSGEQANRYSPGVLSISADGRYVAFFSPATNLVAGDGDGDPGVFVRDRQNGTTERVSVDSTGVEANQECREPSISADGRFVAFHTLADNLVPGDTNNSVDIFVHDRLTGATERVSVDSAGLEGNDPSFRPSLSADGRWVAFESWASNLVSDDTNRYEDIFVHDRSTGANERVSVSSLGAQANNASFDPSISADGRFVAFSTFATNLDPVDHNPFSDVYVRDRQAVTTRLVSVNRKGVAGWGHSEWAAISPDGRYVAFESRAYDLIYGDTNLAADVFLRDTGILAEWSNYGDGFAGTLGVPDLTSESRPCLGTTDRVDVWNSSDAYTVALLFVGLSKTDLPTGKGGHLLVDPVLSEFFGLTPWVPYPLDFAIPKDPLLCGVHVYLQAIEIDPGAAMGLSFTPGLDLMLGL